MADLATFIRELVDDLVESTGLPEREVLQMDVKAMNTYLFLNEKEGDGFVFSSTLSDDPDEALKLNGIVKRVASQVEQETQNRAREFKAQNLSKQYLNEVLNNKGDE